MRRSAVVVLTAVLLWPSAAVAQPSVPKVPDTTTGDSCTPPATAVYRATPWAQHRLAPERVWPLSKGRGVVVAVVDSGVDAGVPQLRSAVLPGADVLASGPADTDCIGHGTFVAGLIAARQATGIGFAGVAPEATILPIRVAGASVRTKSSDVARGIVAAVNGGARVVNVSVSATFPTAELEAAVAHAAAHDVLVVAAVANEAEQGNPQTYPAAYPSVLGVGAIGADGAKGAFSQTGVVSLMAPGVDVVSVGARGPGHLVGNGTSFAAPFVAGVAALVRAYHPKLTAQQVRQRLQQTADHPGKSRPDAAAGWGVVNPYTALTAVLPSEWGAGAVVRPVVRAPEVVWPQPPDTAPGRRAWIVVGVAAGLALFAAAVAGCVRLARRRPA